MRDTAGAAGRHPRAVRHAVVITLLAALSWPAPGIVEGRTVTDETRCLALSMYWEAKGEGAEGMRAVAAVVLNRIASPEFPDDACSVVFEGGETPPCQFSWWCDGESDEPVEPQPWALARELAAELIHGARTDPTRGALFFHHERLESPWVIERERTVQVGEHIYYR